MGRTMDLRMRFVNPEIHSLRCDAFDPHHEVHGKGSYDSGKSIKHRHLVAKVGQGEFTSTCPKEDFNLPKHGPRIYKYMVCMAHSHVSTRGKEWDKTSENPRF